VILGDLILLRLWPRTCVRVIIWNMTHEDLFRYLNRHKYFYDPLNKPDYVKMRYNPKTVLPSGVETHPKTLAGIEGELYTYQGVHRTRVILLYHGGGFVAGSKEMDGSFSSYVVQNSNWDVYTTDYALAPEHPYPEGVEDCFTVYKELCKLYGPSNIILFGESAGATMALATAIYAKKEGIALPQAIILCSPSVQYLEVYPSYTENLDTDCIVTNNRLETLCEYFKTTDPAVLRNPLASPLYADFTGFPPTLIFASDSEVLKDDAIELEKKMKEYKVDVTLDMAHKLMHVYPMYVRLPEAKVALDKIFRFVAKFEH
jgi:epsilon-lactone hydrolase